MELNEHIDEPDGGLLLRYIGGTADDEEHLQAEAWLAADEANEVTLLQMARIYHVCHTRQRIDGRDSSDALRKVNRRIWRDDVRRSVLRAGVAASLLVGVVGSSLSLFHRKGGDEPQYITVSANGGMRSQVTLSDGTTVHLNAGSTLVYPSRYDRKERRVQLSGEAYFDVASKPDQPFVVSAYDEKLNVRVLGTEFNLQAYRHDSLVQLTLAEGSIKLDITGRKSINMVPSEKAVYNINSESVRVETVDTNQEIAWKDGAFIFRDTPMPEVLRRLANFYSVEFDIRDEMIREYTFTGTFNNRPLFQILDYMSISSKIEHSVVYPENRGERMPVIKLSTLRRE